MPVLNRLSACSHPDKIGNSQRFTYVGGRFATFMDIIPAVRPNVLPMDTTWKSVRLRSDCSAAACNAMVAG